MSGTTRASRSPAGGIRFDANLKWLFTEHPFERRFDAAAAAGFAAVEYSSPYEHPPGRLRRALDDSGLRQILINTRQGAEGTPTRSGYACLPDRRGEFREAVLLGLEYATALEASFLHVTAGAVPPGLPADLALATYVSNIAWAAHEAESTPVRLLIEPQNPHDAPGYLLRTQGQAAAVVEAVGSDHLGILLDLYHLQRTEGDLITAFDRHRERIAHVQIADPPHRGEPGTGDEAHAGLHDRVADPGQPAEGGVEHRRRRHG